MFDTQSKNRICLWYEADAEAAAKFYAETFPDSAVGVVYRAPGDYPSGNEGDVLTVEFTVCRHPCMGLNGGPVFTHSEAFSFQILTDDQEETNRYWNAIVSNGGEESAWGFVPIDDARTAYPPSHNWHKRRSEQVILSENG